MLPRRLKFQFKNQEQRIDSLISAADDLNLQKLNMLVRMGVDPAADDNAAFAVAMRRHDDLALKNQFIQRLLEFPQVVQKFANVNHDYLITECANNNYSLIEMLVNLPQIQNNAGGWHLFDVFKLLVFDKQIELALKILQISFVQDIICKEYIRTLIRFIIYEDYENVFDALMSIQGVEQNDSFACSTLLIDAVESKNHKYALKLFNIPNMQKTLQGDPQFVYWIVVKAIEQGNNELVVRVYNDDKIRANVFAGPFDRDGGLCKAAETGNNYLFRFILRFDEVTKKTDMFYIIMQAANQAEILNSFLEINICKQYLKHEFSNNVYCIMACSGQVDFLDKVAKIKPDNLNLESIALKLDLINSRFIINDKHIGDKETYKCIYEIEPVANSFDTAFKLLELDYIRVKFFASSNFKKIIDRANEGEDTVLNKQLKKFIKDVFAKYGDELDAIYSFEGRILGWLYDNGKSKSGYSDSFTQVTRKISNMKV